MACFRELKAGTGANDSAFCPKRRKRANRLSLSSDFLLIVQDGLLKIADSNRNSGLKETRTDEAISESFEIFLRALNCVAPKIE